MGSEVSEGDRLTDLARQPLIGSVHFRTLSALLFLIEKGWEMAAQWNLCVVRVSDSCIFHLIEGFSFLSYNSKSSL